MIKKILNYFNKKKITDKEIDMIVQKSVEDINAELDKSKKEKFIAQIKIKNYKYQTLPDEYKRDMDVLAELVMCGDEVFPYLNKKDGVTLIKVLTENKSDASICRTQIRDEILEDKEYILIMINKDFNYYKSMPKVLKKDPDFMEIFIKSGGDYKDLHEDGKKNIDYALLYIKKNAKNYHEVHPSLHSNIKVVVATLEKSYEMRHSIDFDKLSNEDMTALVISNYELYQYANEQIRSRKDIALRSIGKKISFIEFIGDELKDDLDIFSLNLRGRFLHFAKKNGNVRDNIQIARKAIEVEMWNYKEISLKLQNNIDFVMSLIRKNDNVYSMLTKEMLAEDKVIEWAFLSKHKDEMFDRIDPDIKFSQEFLQKHKEKIKAIDGFEEGKRWLERYERGESLRERLDDFNLQPVSVRKKL